MRQIHQRLIEIQNTQKEQFNRSHKAKDLRVLIVNEKVHFFPNKQGTGHTTWLTGTVSEILDCGHSDRIKGPDDRVYRRNRVHLKPICYDGSTFQTHTTAKEDSLTETPFKTPNQKRGKLCPSKQTQQTSWPEP